MKLYEVKQQQFGVVVKYWQVALTLVAVIQLRISFGLQGGWHFFYFVVNVIESSVLPKTWHKTLFHRTYPPPNKLHGVDFHGP